MLLRKGHKLTLHGGGAQCKRYLHAEDAANAFDAILHKAQSGEIFNLGSIDEISNRDLSTRLIDIVNPPGSDSSSGNSSNIDDWIKITPGRPYTEKACGLDDSKLKSLGWHQNISFDDGLKQTVDWYFAHGDTWWGDTGHMFG